MSSSDQSQEMLGTAAIVAVVLTGIILIAVGKILVASVDWENQEVLRNAYKINLILAGLGGLLSSGTLIAGALSLHNLNKFVRLGMIVGAAYILSTMISTQVPFLYFP